MKDKRLEELLEAIQRLNPANRKLVLKRAKRLLRWQKKNSPPRNGGLSNQREQITPINR